LTSSNVRYFAMLPTLMFLKKENGWWVFKV